jgi:hypothetical protein
MLPGLVFGLSQGQVVWEDEWEGRPDLGGGRRRGFSLCSLFCASLTHQLLCLEPPPPPAIGNRVGCQSFCGGALPLI